MRSGILSESLGLYKLRRRLRLRRKQRLVVWADVRVSGLEGKMGSKLLLLVLVVLLVVLLLLELLLVLLVLVVVGGLELRVVVEGKMVSWRLLLLLLRWLLLLWWLRLWLRLLWVRAEEEVDLVSDEASLVRKV